MELANQWIPEKEALFGVFACVLNHLAHFRCTGESIPRELLVMGALKVLGRGLPFDELEIGSRVSKTAHAAFLHQFIEHFVTHQYSEHIHSPANQAELAECLEPYRNLGFDGAIGSIDCTHIPVPWQFTHQLACH